MANEESPLQDPTGVDDPNLSVQGEPTAPDGGDCPSCGSSTTKDHNGFDICSYSNVPKEHCRITAEEAGTR